MILRSFGLFFSVMVLVFGLQAKAGDVVNVTVGLHQSEIIHLPKDMTNVIIADRNIAGVVKHDNRTVSVIGHDIGKTDIRIMGGKRIVRQINLTVTHDLPAIKKSLKDLFPNQVIGTELVGQSIALTGIVSNAQVASRVVNIVQQFAPNTPVVNLMKLRTGQQVMLRVQVGELKRSALGKMGLGLQGIISAGHTVLGSLEKDQSFKTLAEPTLTAISGQTAEFLAGGEFPVPISQSGAVSVEYKPFGVNIDFTPFVLTENRIRLDVSSEVSELSKAGAVSIASMNIPSVSTRRANTTIELAPGESFMIAGLIRNDYNATVHDVPGLANIPILNVLFRSTAFQRNESELVIAVTPYLVDPFEGKHVRLPTDNLRAPSMMDMMFAGALGSYQNSNSDNTNQSVLLEGPSGFMID